LPSLNGLALLFDAEATGLVEPALIEAAWQFVSDVRDPRPHGELFTKRYDPGKPISLGAMATHHITAEDLVGCPPASSFQLPPDVAYLIGHNIDFDWELIGRPDVKRIDTLSLARLLWPRADSHKQTALLYLLDPAMAREHGRRAHAADVDIQITMRILRSIVSELGGVDSWEALWEKSEDARVPRVMPFGKHKGMAIADVPADYKAWLLRQSDVDPYLAAALRADPAPRAPV
jgi:exodeoxyribonuclease X